MSGKNVLKKKQSSIKKQKQNGWKKFFIIFGSFVLICFLIGIGTLYFLKSKFEVSLPKISDIAENPPVASQIFDRQGRFIASVQLDEYRVNIPITETSELIQKAIVASEDERFFSHKGYDPVGMARAVVFNIKERAIVQGGSTITQQLARDLFLDLEESYTRKFREILLAMELEEKYTKEEILESFMNYQYFGPSPAGRCFGIETTARNFFGKHIKDVSLSEAAIIAGTLDAPSIRSPWYNPEKAMARGNLVLEKMLRNNFITKEQYDEAYINGISQEKVQVDKQEPNIVYLGMFSTETKTDSKYYFVDYIREEIQKLFPEGEKALLHDGLKIYTTLDLEVQNIADDAMRKIFSNAEEKKRFDPSLKDPFDVVQPQGQIVIMKPDTGEILAMIGGRDYANTKFNRCTAFRQPGSLFKLFDYTAAIEAGACGTGTMITSETFSMQDHENVWTPEEWTDGDTFFGSLSARNALIKSSNICAIRVAQWAGWGRVAYYAEKMGVQRPILAVPSMAIGSLEVSPIEMATAFGVMANEGYKVNPISITKITTHSDRKLFVYKNEPLQVVQQSTSILVNDLLQSVFRYTPGGMLPFQAAGKTGTAQDFLSGWFTGYTPDIVACSWVGRDSAEVKVPNARIWGSSFAAPIVKEFLRELSKKQKENSWTSPIYIKETEFLKTNDEIVSVLICKTSGLLATDFCPEEDRIVSRYRTGYAPSYYCSVHREEFVFLKICPKTGKIANQWCPDPMDKRFLKGTEPTEICDEHNVPLKVELVTGILDGNPKKTVGKPIEIHFTINNDFGNVVEVYINNKRKAIIRSSPWFYEWMPKVNGENKIMIVLRNGEEFIYQIDLNVNISK
ncbi:MAG: transglycosylase domain-containing protein [Caldisericia bacterium]|nr:transglycosylase domain-containing protein [Caldisericia bacterium]